MEQIKGTVNRVELIGWVGGEPERRSTPAGTAVCNFRVATKRFGGRSEAGERVVETDWTTIEVWERLAERCSQTLHKGSRVRVIGSLLTQSWDDRETGQRRFKTVVRADEVLFLDPRPELADSTSAPVAEEELVEDLPF